ncbi:FAD:protein FMN transferase [Roseovarius faecimaris]|uniref:FAD:protein FMN transferase n=1 Tax=Roseovarius faecimaris TaxID=2494550 RepID=A0A6I6IR75_9RHOB|nr:FAD:protein FMN transferase [Roseovarius faecimaris]QGX98373.1 FAD:protein FMN transferase [Roseovarius faecimaris]
MTLTRRRFLTMSAVAAGTALTGTATAAATSTWRGRALGAPASLRLAGLTGQEAAPVFAAVEAELARLEGIFSLYRADSALSRLNATGRLDAPPPELLEVLGLCDALHRATQGAFDPSVQPLFVAYAEALRRHTAPDPDHLAAAHARVGWEAVRFGKDQIILERAGAALTLNGIAQGYITDRIAALLRGAGLGNVLIDMGEISALGMNPETGLPWKAGIRGANGALVKRLSLTDRAMATSDPTGFLLSTDGRTGHIFHPRQGDTASGASLVSVSAPQAALADGLSTALCVLDRAHHAEAVRTFPGASLEFIA